MPLKFSELIRGVKRSGLWSCCSIRQKNMENKNVSRSWSADKVALIIRVKANTQLLQHTSVY